MTHKAKQYCVDKIAFGGKGIIKNNTDKVIFVPDSIPGDVVTVHNIIEKKKFIQAELLDLVKPSSFRYNPMCEYSENCGGCNWQGVDYAKQLEWKKEFILDSLRFIKKTDTKSMQKLNEIKIQRSDKQFFYRNRILVRARILQNGRIKLGYFKRASRELVFIQKCIIADQAINIFISKLHELNFKVNAQSLKLEIQALEAVSPFSVSILIHSENYKSKDLKTILQKINKLPNVFICALNIDKKKLPASKFETDRLEYKTVSGQFQQVNTNSNRLLRKAVKGLQAKYKFKSVLDLYCGSGNLSLQLAKANCHVLGFESCETAIKTAQDNLLVNEIKHAKYQRMDVNKAITKLLKQQKLFHTIILDPPRSGAGAIVEYFHAFKAEYIIYISCNPSTLARDLNKLLIQGHYTVLEAVAFDFFPQTYHVETMIVLQKDL